MNYWKKRYNDQRIHATNDLQKNVGRTKNGVSINFHDWEKTVEEIISICRIEDSSVVMELCCGNGVIIGEIAKYCNKAYGIDYSKQ